MIRWLPALVAFFVVVGCSPRESSVQKPEAAAVEDLTFTFQRQKDPAKLKDDADLLGRELSKDLGLPVNVVIPTSYGATVQALISKRADVAMLSSLPYLLAKQETEVEILLVEKRKGRTSYDSVFIVKADSPYQSLSDLKGKRMAFTSPTSGSGYVFPLGHLIQQGFFEAGQKPDTFFGKAFFAGGYDQALRSILRGQADIAAVSDYVMEGDSADKYLTADERSKLRILTRVPGVPTHLIAVRKDLPADLKKEIRAAIKKISETQPELLSDLYGTAEFVAAGEEHVAPTEEALNRTGLQRREVVEK